MTDIYTYLKDYREEEPEWIGKYLRGEQITFKDIMSSRIGYYPGYYNKKNIFINKCDGTLIKVGNKSHSVHSFLYVDDKLKRKDLEEQIVKENSFRGYHSIGQIEWQESDLMPNGQYPIDNEIKPQNANLNRLIERGYAPYCFSVIMERNEDKDDTWGAMHFVVTFLFADGMATYYQLFDKEYSKAPWLFLLNDGYIGTNFERELQRGHCYPQFVIFADDANRWEGYEKVENTHFIFGEFRKRGDLYSYNANGSDA